MRCYLTAIQYTKFDQQMQYLNNTKAIHTEAINKNDIIAKTMYKKA